MAQQLPPSVSIARCACGQTSISVNAAPVLHGVCHCNNCKQRTGSAFGISAYFDRSAVVHITGETLVYAFHHGAGQHDQERHFCPRCGTTLFWYVSTLPDKIGIAGGCFAPGSLPEPDASHRDHLRLPWVTLPEQWTRYGET